MAIILAVFGVSGVFLNTLVLHNTVRNAHIPLAPHSQTPPVGNLPDATPITHRSLLHWHVAKIYYMYIPLIEILNMMLYIYSVSSTRINPD